MASKSKDDVIKALKICCNINCFDCKECPYQNYKPLYYSDCTLCDNQLMKDSAEYLSQE